MEGQITIGYWKIRGLCNNIKTVLEYLQKPYTYVAYEQGDAPELSRESWNSVKFSIGLDFPNLPYLTDGNLTLSETLSIIYYISQKYDPTLLGKTPQDQGQVHMLTALLHDTKMAVTQTLYTQDQFSVTQAKFEEKIVLIAKFLGQRNHFVGDYLTTADLYCFELFELANWFYEGKFLEKFPNFKALSDMLNGLKGIQKWRSSDRWMNGPFNNKSAKLNNKA